MVPPKHIVSVAKGCISIVGSGFITMVMLLEVYLTLHPPEENDTRHSNIQIHLPYWLEEYM